MNLKPTNIAPFKMDDVVWRCMVDDTGRYVWQSSCGAFQAWRHGRHFFAGRNGKAGSKTHATLMNAMASAQAVRERDAA